MPEVTYAYCALPSNKVEESPWVLPHLGSVGEESWPKGLLLLL